MTWKLLFVYIQVHTNTYAVQIVYNSFVNINDLSNMCVCTCTFIYLEPQENPHLWRVFKGIHTCSHAYTTKGDNEIVHWVRWRYGRMVKKV